MLIKHETKRSVSMEGGKSFRANSDGTIEVPDDAVQFLLPAHGFVRSEHPVGFDQSNPQTTDAVIPITATKKRGRPRKDT